MFFSKVSIIALACVATQSSAWMTNSLSTTSTTTQLNAYRQSYQFKLSEMEGEESADYKAATYAPENASPGSEIVFEDSFSPAAPAAPAVDEKLQEFLAQFEEAAALMETKY